MEEDPTADFLAREQAILGADAALFGNPMEEQLKLPAAEIPEFNDFMDATVDVSQTAATSLPVPSLPSNLVEDEINDLTNEMPSPTVPEVKSQALLDWQESFDALVAERDAKEQEKHQRMLKEAQDSLDRFYAEYNEKKQRGIKRNKELQDKKDELAGNVWVIIVNQERAVKMIDYKPAKKDKAKTATDLSRFRGVLNTLKNDKSAPGLVK